MAADVWSLRYHDQEVALGISHKGKVFPFLMPQFASAMSGKVMVLSDVATGLDVTISPLTCT